MGIPTLIATNTDSGDATSSFTSGIDSTYDEYMFVFTDIGPATDNVDFSFQCDVSGSTSYGLTMTTTNFRAYHDEGGSSATVTYVTADDQAQGTGFQLISNNTGNEADESCAGILHLFSPASTTYVKHFYCRVQNSEQNTNTNDIFVAGYFNTTTAIDKIQFKMSSGNMDGVIQMYGIA